MSELAHYHLRDVPTLQCKASQQLHIADTLPQEWRYGKAEKREGTAPNMAMVIHLDKSIRKFPASQQAPVTGAQYQFMRGFKPSIHYRRWELGG